MVGGWEWILKSYQTVSINTISLKKRNLRIVLHSVTIKYCKNYMNLEQTMKRYIPNQENLLYHQIMLTVESVWGSSLSRIDIERWLLNFDGSVFKREYERRLALYLLANFVYYNENEVRHLCKTLFYDYLHWILWNETSNNKVNTSIQTVLDSAIQSSCFCPLGQAGESGAFVLYYFRQENHIATKQISDSTRPPAYAQNIVYVDDVTISGDEAKKYLLVTDKTRNHILLTFLATNEAIQILNKKGIHVISSIILDERSKCFSDKSSLYRNFQSSFEDCKKFAEEYGKKSMLSQENPVQPLGHDNGQYTIGFFYNTPDNTLPIFWAENANWTSLMRRYEKYREVPYREYPRFV
jgi:hypothetical protein